MITREDLIQVGDKVHVAWENVLGVYDAEVLVVPGGPGEVWILKERNGTVSYVMTYSRMTKVRPIVRKEFIKPPRDDED